MNLFYDSTIELSFIFVLIVLVVLVVSVVSL